MNLKQDLLLFCIFYSLFFKTANANRRYFNLCPCFSFILRPMQSFWHPFEPLPLALGHGADRTYSFFLILAQHRLFFLLLIGSSSKDIRRTSVGRETFIFFLICHATQISITNSLNRTLCRKIWASYYSESALSVDVSPAQNVFAQAHY